jgi:hypothetical protein
VEQVRRALHLDRHTFFLKREQTSASRWHVEVRREDPADVDRELASWLKAAMALSS